MDHSDTAEQKSVLSDAPPASGWRQCHVRSLMGTDAYRQSGRERKKIETL